MPVIQKILINICTHQRRYGVTTLVFFRERPELANLYTNPNIDGNLLNIEGNNPGRGVKKIRAPIIGALFSKAYSLFTITLRPCLFSQLLGHLVKSFSPGPDCRSDFLSAFAIAGGSAQWPADFFCRFTIYVFFWMLSFWLLFSSPFSSLLSFSQFSLP